jgi:hypothetical protein
MNHATGIAAGMKASALILMMSAVTGQTAVASDSSRHPTAPDEAIASFCQQAQQVVSRTSLPFTLEHYTDFAAFARSKAHIDPPTIRQYTWYEDDAQTRPAMVSCKLKSADHLNMVFGDGTAGPDGRCQDMNRQTLAQVIERLGARADFAVTLDPYEDVMRDNEGGSIGPAWLAPYVMIAQTGPDRLLLRSKGFRVDFGDPRFAASAEEFRGIHYCHLIAPGYLERLLTGEAEAGRSYGVDVSALQQ